jgi:hypothetical protein
VYTIYLFKPGRGGRRGWRVKPQRRGEDGNSWFEYTNMTDIIYLFIYLFYTVGIGDRSFLNEKH